ncbi:MAG: butyrate kinase [Oligoflexia bacterium]|nr:butyrate kinase [Oligoflexia bacterium]
MKRMLIINPGSTSTKVAVYEGKQGCVKEVTSKTIRHEDSELKAFKGKPVILQEEYRTQLIITFLKDSGIELETLDAIAGRGGFVPVQNFQSGVFAINKDMIHDLKTRPLNEHPCNLGAILAQKIATVIEQKSSKTIPSVIMDPVVVDEMMDISRISGMKEIELKSFFHCLNQKAVSRRFARKVERNYEDLNLIIAHMGGGVSVSAHRKGKVIDTNNAMNGLGPFSPERTGGVDTRALIDLCFSGKYSKEQLCLMNVGEGGLFSYLGTSDARKVEKLVESGDKQAKLVYQAMAYQIAKAVAAYAASFLPDDGKIDAILLTGGLAYDRNYLIPWITARVNKIAPVEVFPGEDEILALAEGLLDVLEERQTLKIYSSPQG